MKIKQERLDKIQVIGRHEVAHIWGPKRGAPPWSLRPVPTYWEYEDGIQSEDEIESQKPENLTNEKKSTLVESTEAEFPSPACTTAQIESQVSTQLRNEKKSTFGEFTEAKSPSLAYTAAGTTAPRTTFNPWQVLAKHSAHNPHENVSHENDCNPGSDSLLETADSAALDPENDDSKEEADLDWSVSGLDSENDGLTAQVDLDSSNQPRPSFRNRQKLRYAEKLEGWEQIQGRNFIPSDPIDIAKDMLSKVSEKYPEPYKAYIRQNHLERELLEELSPNAWEVFQSKEYTRQR